MNFVYRLLLIFFWAVAMGFIVYFVGIALGDKPDLCSIRGFFVFIGAFGVGCIRWWKTRNQNK